MAGKDKKDEKAPGGSPHLESVESYIVKDPEAFAQNMARAIEAAGKAASAWIKPREEGKVDQLSEPVTDLVKTFSKVSEYWLSDPARALDAQTRLFANYMTVWTNSIRRASGDTKEDVIKPEPGDKRFADPDWDNNAFFDFVKQAYLVTSQWANELVSGADGLDDKTRHKAEFYVQQIANALSPSNFLLTNPELFRETVGSNGENIVRGMKMLAEDIAAGKGDVKIRQVDPSNFQVGRNMATTPGKVVARSETAEIIQYEATTETVIKRPLLICPPWINKFYILDLNPEKSFIKWCVDQGQTVFVISWVNPDERHRKKTWEAYIEEGITLALDTIEEITGEKKVNSIGYCVGGSLLSAALAMFARDGEKRIQSATLFTTQVDFTYGGDLLVFVDEEQIQGVERQMEDKGYLDGGKMASAFNMLRSRDLIWSYAVNNYMRGRTPMAFDLLYWNSDSTRMTAANHSFYLRNCYLENNLSKGNMVLGGAPINLKDVTIPIYNLAAKEDHIAPAKSVFHGCQFFGGDVQYVMAGSGHIAGVVNPPDKVKYQYWTGGKPEGKFEDWVAKADEHPGSWWPHWQKWIESMETGKRVKARKVGGEKIEPICDAPGTYVMERV